MTEEQSRRRAPSGLRSKQRLAQIDGPAAARPHAALPCGDAGASRLHWANEWVADGAAARPRRRRHMAIDTIRSATREHVWRSSGETLETPCRHLGFVFACSALRAVGLSTAATSRASHRPAVPPTYHVQQPPVGVFQIARIQISPPT